MLAPCERGKECGRTRRRPTTRVQVRLDGVAAGGRWRLRWRRRGRDGLRSAADWGRGCFELKRYPTGARRAPSAADVLAAATGALLREPLREVGRAVDRVAVHGCAGARMRRRLHLVCACLSRDHPQLWGTTRRRLGSLHAAIRRGGMVKRRKHVLEARKIVRVEWRGGCFLLQLQSPGAVRRGR